MIEQLNKEKSRDKLTIIFFLRLKEEYITSLCSPHPQPQPRGPQPREPQPRKTQPMGPDYGAFA